jgi:hypothetical protein
VTELTPGRSFVWEAKGPGLTLMASHLLTPGDDGTVTVALGVAQGGAVGRVLKASTTGRAKRYVRMAAAGLKRQSEAP